MGLRLPPQVRVYGAFLVYAFALGSLYPRVGDIQLALGIGEGILGLALIGVGAGTFVSLTFAPPWLERWSYRGIIIFGTSGISLIIGLATLAPNAGVLFGTLFLAGLLVGAVEIVLNVEADRTEHLLGRRLMSRCHAFWSFGAFGAGLMGSLAKQAAWSPTLHLLALTPAVTVAIWLFAGQLTPAAARSHDTQAHAATPRFTVPSAGILALVAFTLSAMFLEGAGADWSVILMRDTFAAPPFVNGLAFTVGALAQALARYHADAFVDRFGPLRVAAILLALLGLGTVLVATSVHPAMALVGFALMGGGTSAIFPLAMSAAAQRTDRPAAVNVAALAQLSFVAFLVGPPLLGFVAESFGARMSFAVCLPFVVLSTFFIRTIVPAKR